MTLDEKIGQMTQVEKNSIRPGDITKYYIGSILSGGGGHPGENTAQGWYEMVEGFQREALKTRLKIPIIYGVDAVHGHGNMLNATIFPHNIGLGATNDPELMKKIGRATAEEMLATGIPWNFSPVVRSCRMYVGDARTKALAKTRNLSHHWARHIFRDSKPDSGGFPDAGQTIFGWQHPNISSAMGGRSGVRHAPKNYMLDQGNMQFPEEAVRRLFLPPYQSAVEAGAMNVMGSFSSWKGTKMHAQQYLLTNVLKDELGFKGFIVSDWQGIDQIVPDYYYASVVTAVNAGIDMNMVPSDYVNFIETMKQAVNNGDIPEIARR